MDGSSKRKYSFGIYLSVSSGAIFSASYSRPAIYETAALPTELRWQEITGCNLERALTIPIAIGRARRRLRTNIKERMETEKESEFYQVS